MLVYGTKAENRVTHLTNLALETFAPMRQASRVKIKVENRLDVELALTQMKEVTDALNTCVEDLQKLWNIGEEREALLKRAPRATRPLHSVFSYDDYPAVAAARGISGSTNVVLLIDETGAVADCTVDRTSGVASLDAQTCYVLKNRAKFKPAIGADGNPARSFYSSTVSWRIV